MVRPIAISYQMIEQNRFYKTLDLVCIFIQTFHGKKLSDKNHRLFFDRFLICFCFLSWIWGCPQNKLVHLVESEKPHLLVLKYLVKSTSNLSKNWWKDQSLTSFSYVFQRSGRSIISCNSIDDFKRGLWYPIRHLLQLPRRYLSSSSYASSLQQTWKGLQKSSK